MAKRRDWVKIKGVVTSLKMKPDTTFDVEFLYQVDSRDYVSTFNSKKLTERVIELSYDPDNPKRNSRANEPVWRNLLALFIALTAGGMILYGLWHQVF